MTVDAELLLPTSCALARRAGDAILSVYGQQFEVTNKADQSPLTLADTQSHEIIVQGLQCADAGRAGALRRSQRHSLQRAPPVAALLAGRSARRHQGIRLAQRRVHGQHRADRRARRRCWASCTCRSRDTTYTGVPASARRGRPAASPQCRFTRRTPAPTPLRIVGSRSHRDAVARSISAAARAVQLVAVGSSIKFCLVAEGSADFYPRFGPTSEWDTAAAQAVVEAAGGRVIQTDGQRLRYNAKAELLNPHFLVSGDPSARLARRAVATRLARSNDRARRRRQRLPAAASTNGASHDERGRDEQSASKAPIDA